MKKSVLLALLIGFVSLGAWRVLRADDATAPAPTWEYMHLLIPLDRVIETYQKSDERLLKPLQDAGAQGWELVSANEPPNGALVHGHASVEFFLKRHR